jgi:DNA modification methylase
MKSLILLKKSNDEELPINFRLDDNRFSETFVEYFIRHYVGDKILDIFAGFGTTILIAEKLNRIGYGIESNEERYDYIKSKVSNDSTIIKGSSLSLDQFNLPEVDFSLTSPPYMNANESTNPLTNLVTEKAYLQYLNHLRLIYRKLKVILKPKGYAIVEVSNLKFNGITTLAWDIARELSKELLFKGEIIIGWQGEDTGNGIYGYGYDHSYCLIFTNEIC